VEDEIRRKSKLLTGSRFKLEIESEFQGSRHKFLSKSGRYIYHIGIIDYLQEFNFDKKLENRLKVFLNKEGAQISAIQPKPYATRYMKFMRDKVIIDQKEGKAGEAVMKKMPTRHF